MANCNENVAFICGTNAGIIADLLNDLIRDELEETIVKADRKYQELLEKLCRFIEN